jgi:hypothetical protein
MPFGALGFSATNTLDRAAVNDLTERTVNLARASATLLVRPSAFDHSKVARKKWAAEEKEKAENADADWLRNILNEIESRISNGRAGVDIQGRIMSLGAEVEEKAFPPRSPIHALMIRRFGLSSKANAVRPMHE